ncbi:hypothetical protein [Streptomyces cahuitamycinicus]|uniref:Glycosyl hydrolase n=1 Tax=Streptomyces cahuitamycinicus TaxID=2070367 RepID=A0A2N8TX86_9ACTN|nr:hypothetical protein [Streptomyces cahuitamycinicus]PNG23633.1 hypothetical protein C1J00_02700 [Streptomyces cahuitamycinicus]
MTHSGDLIPRLLADASSGPAPGADITGLCRHAEQEGRYWFFGGDGGDTALLYDAADDTVVQPAAPLASHWPLLLGTEAARGTDACYTTYHRQHGYHWFFAGEQALQYHSAEGVVLQGPCPLGDLFRFSGEAADFARGVHAVCPPGPRDGLFWFFRGDRALQYDTREGRITEPVRPLVAYWPGLSGTVFANGIDAGYTTHHTPDGRHWLFTGGQAGLYDSARHTFRHGPAPFAELFPTLREDLARPRSGPAVS